MSRKSSKPLVFVNEYDPMPPEELHQTLKEIYRILVEELVAQGAPHDDVLEDEPMLAPDFEADDD